jgi:hypothetical protein
MPDFGTIYLVSFCGMRQHLGKVQSNQRLKIYGAATPLIATKSGM